MSLKKNIFLSYNNSLLFFFFMFLYTSSYSQTIYTFAGNKQFGFGPDGTKAINVPLNNSMTCLRFGNDGFLYLNDNYNNLIRKINTNTNTIYTVAGNGISGFSGDGGSAISASLNGVISFVLDSLGNIFLCDTYNHRIRRVDDKTGIIKTIAGNGSTIYTDKSLAYNTGLPFPTSIDIDNIGNLYIGTCDIYNYRYNFIFICNIINYMKRHFVESAIVATNH